MISWGWVETRGGVMGRDAPWGHHESRRAVGSDLDFPLLDDEFRLGLASPGSNWAPLCRRVRSLDSRFDGVQAPRLSFSTREVGSDLDLRERPSGSHLDSERCGTPRVGEVVDRATVGPPTERSRSDPNPITPMGRGGRFAGPCMRRTRFTAINLDRCGYLAVNLTRATTGK